MRGSRLFLSKPAMFRRIPRNSPMPRAGTGCEYHLSPERPNLLRAFDWDRRSRVLEVGAGCGAVTRFLGERFDEVVAVEGDPARALNAALRVRDLDGVSVVNGNFQSLELGEFDLLVAIGVLEYAHLYSDSAYPHQEALLQMRSRLGDAGLLVLALENKLGMKYFAGAREDHSSIRFDSIEGYSRSGRRTGVTFGQTELARLLSDAGFETVSFFYPFPDYKFARSIVAGDVGPAAAAGLSEFIGTEGTRGDGQPVFDSRLAWREALQNGLLGAAVQLLLGACRDRKSRRRGRLSGAGMPSP